MAPVAIVTDTCHYLPRQLVAARGIHEVSLYVHWDEREDRESDLPDFDAYYRFLTTTGELPTTSQPSIGDFLAVYEPLLAEGREIVSIHLAGGMSGTVGSAEQAKQQLEGRGGDRVHVLDSASACGGEGIVVLAAHAAAARGASAEAVIAHARDARAAMKMWFAIDTLEYLRRGGRIAAAQAWLGSALRIKPILTVEQEITPIERVRTSGRAFERLVEYMHTLHDDGADAWVVQHIQAPEQAGRLVEIGRQLYGTDPAFVSEIGPVIGTHVGPGLLGVGAAPSRFLS
ncbi:MAG: degV family protein [Conexibacter sp.]|jgi:DegV family protein with EDD domain|nr:degV family protein [Conexibacter sp.]